MALEGKNLRRINRIEKVLRTAKLAPHLDVAALGNDAFDLVRAQAAQHVAHALA